MILQALVLLFSAALVMCGCISTTLAGDNQPLEEDGGATPQAFDALDLLFVIDNATGGPNPMDVARSLPNVVRTLLSGDSNNDGDPEFRGVRSLQVAVVTTDMGAPGIEGLADCGEDTGKPLGDDGLFFTGQPGLVVDDHVCGTQPAVLSINLPASEDARAQFDDALSCAATVAVGGCGYRMPLEAALKSSWDRDDSTVSFLNGTGHGISLQSGFVRDGALLAIIVITDGDDCSSADVTHLTPASSLAPDHPMARVGRWSRCVRYEDHLHPIGRYEEGFARLKRGVVSDFFFGVIGGIPTDFAAELRDQRIERARVLVYKRLLDDSRMQNVVDPGSPPAEERLLSVCGDAVPSRRLAELSRRFEDLSTAASICDPMEVSLGTMTKAIARLIDPATAL